MSDARDNRFEIDLEEIERQLRASVEAASVVPPPALAPAAAHAIPPQSRASISLPGPTGSDPLAELARIVGQDDPFRGILGDANRPDPARSPAIRPDPALTAEDREILGADSAGADQPVLNASRGGGAFDPVSAAYGSLDNAVDDREYEPLPPRRSRARLVGVLAVLLLAVGGAAGALVWRKGGVNFASNGLPPLIQADKAPLKVAPDNPGGVDIPNQNRQIYERAVPEGKARVVDRQEQPIDVREAARSMPAAEPPSVSATLPPAPGTPRPAGNAVVANVSPSVVAPLPGNPSLPSNLSSSGTSGDQRPSSQVGASLGGARPSNAVVTALGEPRRVRTVTVRPDGSVAPTGPMAAAPIVPMSIPTDQLPPPVSVPTISIPVGTPQSTVVASATPSVATPPSSTPAVSVLPPARPRVATAALAPDPVAATSAVVPDPAPPVAEAVPPAGQSVVSVKPPSRPAGIGERVASAATAPASTPVADAATSGSFVVQIATRNSEPDAQAAYTQLVEKYGADLNGKPAAIAQGEVRGKAVYRVRVGPLARGDANALCARLKTAGGACLVTVE